MTDTPLDALSTTARKKLKRTSQPDWVDPMLATLTDNHFSSPEWIFERKLDGVRCLVHCKDENVRLMSRNRNAMNATYPELVEAVADLTSGDLIADGEIVAFEGNVTSFSKLQGRLGLNDPEEAKSSGVRVFLYLFDVMHADGFDTTALTVRERKQVLKSAFRFTGSLRYTPHRNERGESWLREACQKGWEGLIAKQADSTYVHSRSKKWLKFKCTLSQEFVIGGFTEPNGARVGFGALLIGVHDSRGRLRYAGKVGTGFDDASLEDLSDQLKRRERKSSPFDQSQVDENSVHWVTPELVGQVAFTEWTEDGKLRHPRFLGLRTDKEPVDVVRERPS